MEYDALTKISFDSRPIGGSKNAHASNGWTKCLATCLQLRYTTDVTSQKIGTTDEFLWPRLRSSGNSKLNI